MKIKFSLILISIAAYYFFTQDTSQVKEELVFEEYDPETAVFLAHLNSIGKSYEDHKVFHERL